MKKHFLLTIALVATFTACFERTAPPPNCPTTPPATPPEKWPAPGEPASIEAEDTPAAASSPCGLSCANWKRLECPEAFPNKVGMSCYRVCAMRAKLVTIPSKCWIEAQTVEALRACGGIRCGDVIP